MIKLGNLSTNRLDTCHPKLIRLIRAVAERIPAPLDFSVTCGHRGEAEQEAAFKAGKSTKHWPHSLHNGLPSRAIDLAPYPVDWNDYMSFARLAGYVQAVADDLGIRIRWGADWNDNGKTRDERLVDAPHFELHRDE
jgi:peptidoglycan L-alanyl-D-glutamate endopeptidase CwlK